MFPYSCTVKSNDGSTIYAEFSDNEPCPVIINDNGFKCLDDAGEDYEANAELWTLSNGAIRDGANIILPFTIKGFSTTQGAINPDTNLSIGAKTYFANTERETLFTVVEAVSRISVNLATAFPDKWAGLTIGEQTIQIRAKNPGNYLDSDLSTAKTFYKTVPITVTATNCTAAASNPTEFPDVGGGDTILTFNKKTGYTLPETIVITGVAGQNIGYSWTVASDGQSAQLKILKALGNIEVTVTGVVETTTTIDGGTYKWLDSINLREWAQEINFTSNGASYSGMRYTGNGTAMTLQYMNADSEWQTVYNYDEDASTGSWVNTAWQIVDLGTSAQKVTAFFKADFVANTTHLTVCSEYTIVSENTIIRG